MDIGIANFELHAYIRKSHEAQQGLTDAYEDMDSRFTKFELTYVGSFSAAE